MVCDRVYLVTALRWPRLARARYYSTIYKEHQSSFRPDASNSRLNILGVLFLFFFLVRSYLARSWYVVMFMYNDHFVALIQITAKFTQNSH